MADAPGPPVFPGFQQYAVLTLTLGSGDGSAKLSLDGPKLPGIGATVAIGVGIDKNGDYHFLVGSGDKVYRPQDVPAELRKMFGGSGGGPNSSARKEMLLPSRKIVTRETDGAFKTFEQYDNGRRFYHSGVPGEIGSPWPELTREVYDLLIDLYSGKGQRPRDYGDYPLPAGDTGLA